jgi:hypothetical protein
VVVRFLTFITIFLVFGSVGNCQTPDSTWNIPRIEVWLRNQDLNSPIAREALEVLIEKYFMEEKLQEAAWTYRRFGNMDLATQVELELGGILANSRLSFVRDLTGVDESKLVRLGDHEIFGVFKAKNKYHQNEVLAYRLSVLLGLNLVPMTIFRNHPQFGRGSLQFFIKDAHHSNQDPYTLSTNMWLLDYLLENTDRRSSNWILRNGSHPVAIDHGHTLRRAGALKPKLQINLLPDGKVLERLIRLSPEDFADLGMDTRLIFRKRATLLSTLALKKANEFQFLQACRILVKAVRF